METLIVTNGTSGVDALRAAGIEEVAISWDDVLHDGPVGPGDLHPAEMAEVRARFLSGQGWASLEDARDALVQRDLRLDLAAERGARILVWLEHDLYDQLQRLQVLARGGNLWEVRMSEYVAEASAQVLREAFDGACAVDSAALREAKEAWSAFCAFDPRNFAALAGKSTEHPALAKAVRRWVQMFPDEASGLSRTERWVLEQLTKRPRTAAWLFRESQATEDARFRGDWSFQSLVVELGVLLERVDGGRLKDPGFFAADLQLTRLGRDVVAGRRDRVGACGLDTWRGGCHLTTDSHWRRTAIGELVRYVQDRRAT